MESIHSGPPHNGLPADVFWCARLLKNLSEGSSLKTYIRNLPCSLCFHGRKNAENYSFCASNGERETYCFIIPLFQKVARQRDGKRKGDRDVHQQRD